MGLFDRGDSSASRTQVASPAQIAAAQFALQLMQKRYGQTGGAQQSFGDFRANGPRGWPEGLDFSGLEAAYAQPGAFDQRMTGTMDPGSPSLFEQGGQALSLLVALNSLFANERTGETPAGRLWDKVWGKDGERAPIWGEPGHEEAGNPFLFPRDATMTGAIPSQTAVDSPTTSPYGNNLGSANAADTSWLASLFNFFT